jgi:hypothetical protein
MMRIKAGTTLGAIIICTMEEEGVSIPIFSESCLYADGSGHVSRQALESLIKGGGTSMLTMEAVAKRLELTIESALENHRETTEDGPEHETDKAAGGVERIARMKRDGSLTEHQRKAQAARQYGRERGGVLPLAR